MRREYTALLALVSLFTAATVSSQDLEIGRLLWLSNCSACHGENGKPTLPLTPDISRGEGMEKSRFQHLRTVRNGSGNMPAFAGAIRDEFIVDIVTYMMTLYPAVSRPLNTGDPNLM